MSRVRLAYLAEGAGDIVIFQQLPLHVKSRVLKEGRVLFVRDEDALYAVAITAARAFEGFRHRYRAYLDEVAVVDRDRVLAKLDEVDGYLDELRLGLPREGWEYARIEKKRSCERLLQLAVEATIDACAMLVSGLRLGLPGEENDLFEKLARRGVISEGMTYKLSGA